MVRISKQDELIWCPRCGHPLVEHSKEEGIYVCCEHKARYFTLRGDMEVEAAMDCKCKLTNNEVTRILEGK